jgi:hypothetical protein
MSTAKRTVAILIFGAALAQAVTCQDWLKYSDSFRAGYAIGITDGRPHAYGEGYMAGVLVGKGKKGGQLSAEEFLSAMKDMDQTDADPFMGMTFGRIKDGIDGICKAPENALIDTTKVVFAFALKVGGRDQKAVDSYLQSARAVAAREKVAEK